MTVASPISLVLAAVGTIFVTWSIFHYVVLSRRPQFFPPGPPTLPIIGNLHQLPLTKSFLQFQSWSKQYGSIIGLKFGPQNVVVLNKWEHVRELIDNRGSIYSSRAYGYIPNALVCPGDVHILFTSYNNSWRAQRKVMQSLLNVNVVDRLLPIQNAESAQMMHDLLHHPEDFYHHAERYTVAVILASVFGQRGETYKSRKVGGFYEVQGQWSGILEAGATPPIDIFTFLRHLPDFLCSWKRSSKFIREKQTELYFGLLNETKERMKDGKSTDCYMARLLRERQKTGFNDYQLAYLGGFLLEAGSDTTSNTLLCFILAMAAHPEIQKRAQAEVDAVCGPDNPPAPEHHGKFEYINACMMETMRWRPVLPAGVPHVLDRDDTYQDFLLPKHTMVIFNTWALHHDPDEYESPESFNPDRYLSNPFGTKHANPEADSRRRETYGFGAGRRVCAGQRMAENSLTLTMAKLVWSFNIVADEPLDTDMATGFTQGILIAPKPFPAKFVPRSAERTRTVEQNWEAADKFLAQFSN